MIFGSLFTGIGGIDLGFERAGMECAWQVEIDDYCNRVLEKHWPEVERFRDVREVGKHNLSPVDLITGGFPCQPHSVAGKRRGKDDDRNLWPQYLRIIQELKPRWVVGENVPGIITTMLDDVLADLEGSGYTPITFNIPAAAFGANHQRYRIIVVAHANCYGLDQQNSVESYQGRKYLETPKQGRRDKRGKSKQYSEDVADTNGNGCAWSEQQSGSGNTIGEIIKAKGRRKNCKDQKNKSAKLDGCYSNVSNTDKKGMEGTPISRKTEGSWANAIELPFGFDTFTNNWSVEPNVGRVADGVPNRVDRLKSLGNAVVPQVAEFIGRCILEADKLDKNMERD